MYSNFMYALIIIVNTLMDSYFMITETLYLGVIRITESYEFIRGITSTVTLT